MPFYDVIHDCWVHPNSFGAKEALFARKLSCGYFYKPVQKEKGQLKESKNAAAAAAAESKSESE